jgi:hypothetical protein
VERWVSGSWRIQEVSRLKIQELDSLQQGVDKRLREKRVEFKRLIEKTEIKIDEVAIHREIQEILAMSEEELEIMQRDIERKLREKREEFNRLVGGYWG